VRPAPPLVSDGVALDGLDGSVPSADTSHTTGEQALSTGIPTISDALDGSDGSTKLVHPTSKGYLSLLFRQSMTP